MIEYRIKKKLSRWDIFWGAEKPKYIVQYKLFYFWPFGPVWVEDTTFYDLDIAKEHIKLSIEEESIPIVKPVEEYIYYPEYSKYIDHEI